MKNLIVPPIKCQGIKTKIVPEIKDIVDKYELSNHRWVEPFVGSGVILFNINPQMALINDINPHIINFYKDIQNKKFTSKEVKFFLELEGQKLLENGEKHYYHIRDRFNKKKCYFDFLFLNRSCFNGLIRFNQKENFNVPFCKKNERFRQAYVTKIVNQVKNTESLILNKSWEFKNKDWKEILKQTTQNDIVYLDPPYIGRHTDYYNTWTEKDAEDMLKLCMNLECKFIVSMWKKNKYRENEYIKKWKGCKFISIKHFYHIGSKESLRNEMEEVLILGNF